VLSDKGAKVSEAYGTALDIPFLGKFSNRQTYIIDQVCQGYVDSR
jgi:peroxiredoxin